MKIERISASAASNYNGCQMQYYLDYVLKWRFPAGKAANIGTVTHKILEILGKIRQEQFSGKHYKKDTFGIEVTADEEIPIDYVIEKVYNHYDKGEFSNNHFTKADLKNCTGWTYYALEHNDGQFSPLKREIISLEKYFRIPMEEEWARLDNGDFLCMSGIIDAVYGVDDDCMELVDWKTGQRKDWNTGLIYTHKRLHDNLQLRMYHYALNELYGYDKDYLITIFYLKDGGPFTIHFSPDDVDHTILTLRDLFGKINNNVRPEQSRSWKCNRMCPFGKNTFGNEMFKGMNLPVFKQNSHNGIVDLGETCSICDQINYEFNMYKMDFITKKYGKKPKEKKVDNK